MLSVAAQSNPPWKPQVPVAVTLKFLRLTKSMDRPKREKSLVLLGMIRSMRSASHDGSGNRVFHTSSLTM